MAILEWNSSHKAKAMDRKTQKMLDSELYNAVRNGDLVMVKRGVENGGRPNIPVQMLGKTPYELAEELEKSASDPLKREAYSKIKQYLSEVIRNMSDE